MCGVKAVRGCASEWIDSFQHPPAFIYVLFPVSTSSGAQHGPEEVLSVLAGWLLGNYYST